MPQMLRVAAKFPNVARCRIPQYLPIIWSFYTWIDISLNDMEWSQSRSTHTCPDLFVKIALPALATTLVLFCVQAYLFEHKNAFNHSLTYMEHQNIRYKSTIIVPRKLGFVIHSKKFHTNQEGFSYSKALCSINLFEWSRCLLFEIWGIFCYFSERNFKHNISPRPPVLPSYSFLYL